MKDAGSALRAAYVQLLATLTYQDKPVKLYSLQAPNAALAPYVILGPWVQNRDNTKYRFGQSGEINLDVVTRSVGDTRSTKATGEIANLITQLIKPTPTSEVFEPTGFRVWMTQIEGTQDLSDPTNTDTITRKLITVSHNITEI